MSGRAFHLHIGGCDTQLIQLFILSLGISVQESIHISGVHLAAFPNFCMISVHSYHLVLSLLLGWVLCSLQLFVIRSSEAKWLWGCPASTLSLLFLKCNHLFYRNKESTVSSAPASWYCLSAFSTSLF